MSYQLHSVPVTGGELTVATWGAEDSETVILAPHGITANHTCWQPLADLMPEARIIAPDHRGRGGSHNLGKPYGLMQHARDLEATLDFFNAGQPIVVGHSMGGFVAIRFAANYPKRVSSLVLVDGGLPLNRPSGVATDDLVSATLGPAAERLAKVFESREQYQQFWEQHPAFKDDFNKYVSAYVDYDLMDFGSGLRPSGQIKAVEADIRELFGEPEYLKEMQSIKTPVVFLKAPRGLLNNQALYSDPTNHHAELLTNLKIRQLDDFNHYTIVLSEAGSRLIAEEISALIQNKLRQET